jgi:hypothetical protein
MQKFNPESANTLDEVRVLAQTYGAKCTLIRFDKSQEHGLSNPQLVSINAKIAYSHMSKPELRDRPRVFKHCRTKDQFIANPSVQYAPQVDLNSLSSEALLEKGFVRADDVKPMTNEEMLAKLKADGAISGNVKLKTEGE